jgi:DNA-binding transcriptional LysR family regulator
LDLSNHLDKLKAFKVIVESRTMREAALRLNVTQPALTKLVQNLENATKTSLLSRGRMGVAPTKAGQELFEYSCSVLNSLEDLEQRLLHPANEMAGLIRIGAYASLAEYLWPEFIPALQKKFPALRISIFTSESISHAEALAGGRIDILVDAEPRLSDQLISWNLYEDRFGFFMSKSKAEEWEAGSTDSAPLIYSPAAFDFENKRILQHLEEKGYHFKERMEFDSFMAVLAFAKKGLGLAVLPNRLAHAAVNAGQLRRVSLKGFSSKGFGPHHFAATIRENRKDDPRLRLLISELKGWFRR